MTQPPNPPVVVRVLPYLNVIDFLFRNADRVVHFTHAHGKGTHRLTDHEVATLRAGGTIVFQDSSGNSHHLRS